LRVLSGSRNVPAVGGNTHGPCESACRSRSNSINHFGGVIVRMLARDFVCGWTISPSPRHPDDRAFNRDRPGDVADSRPVQREQLADGTTQLRQGFDDVDEVVLPRVLRAGENARIRSTLSSVSATLGRGGCFRTGFSSRTGFASIASCRTARPRIPVSTTFTW
jgi:hypothetical protein